MKVFQVTTDGESTDQITPKYAGLICATSKDEDLLELDDFAGKPFPRKWRTPTLRVSMPLLPRPDFLNFGLEFVCNEKAVELAGEALEMSGELLPVKLQREKGKFFIFNCTNCINVLDHKRSVWRMLAGKHRRLDKPAFLKDGFGEPTLFKIAEDGATRLYCLERTGDPRDGEFKALVESAGLTGVTFKKVWSGGR